MKYKRGSQMEINLGHIANSGQCFRWVKENDNTYSFITKGQYFKCNVDKNDILSISEPSKLGSFLYDYFDLSTDYLAIRESADKDDIYLQMAIQQFGDITILRQDLWEVIVSFIISQRKSIPAIQTCIQQLCQHFGEKIVVDNQEKGFTFPTPESILSASLNELNQCGVGYRNKYLISAAKWYLSIQNNMITKDALMEIYGVGEKVCNCICLFGLHDLSCCPIDVWMKKVIDQRYDGHFPQWMDSEYAGVYQQYVFMYERSLNRR